MLRIGAKSITFLFALLAFCTCIDPYYPKLEGYESLLVVEGLVTDENSSYMVKLSRTIEDENLTPVKVSDATVFITDDRENKISLQNKGKGIYKTDSTQFMGIIGRTYTLNIVTKDGNEYNSDPCIMESVPEIESIYFVKDQELVNHGTDMREGIRICLDSYSDESNKYYRWSYEETWKFKVPSPKKYEYLNDSTFKPVETIKEYCWKNKLSDEVLIRSAYSGESGRIEKEPVLFIASGESDRLLMQYSILIRQYSISKKEYDYWDNLKRINESGGDLFATQPFPVISNIHNINDPHEQILGYFQVSAVKEKRRDIPFSDVVGLGLPVYRYPCERIEMAPEDYPRSPYSPPFTWDDLYQMYCVTSDYYFVEPKFKGTSSQLDKLVFARPECADCELTGTMSKPDFWIDYD